MNRLVVPVALCVALPLLCQESSRNLDRPGEHHKHLTIDTVDRWVFDAPADEVVRTDVLSSDFDPVIEFVRIDAAGLVTEVIVPAVDEPGSRSHLLTRLARAGRFAILVHGPENRGGGNYRLFVERFRSVPLDEDTSRVDSQLDPNGMAHVRFHGRAGETVAPNGAGIAEVLDPMGHSLDQWEGCYDLRRDGEHFVRVRGSAGARFRVGIERARRRDLGASDTRTDTLPPHGVDEWRFAGKPDEFRALTVVGDRLAMRVAVVEEAEASSGALDQREALRWLPAHQKGATRRQAFVIGRERAYRVLVRSTSPDASEYRLVFGDPSQALPAGTALERVLELGASEFFTFKTTPGQVLRVDVHSAAFDPVLRLTTAEGNAFGENDDGGGDLASRYGWLVETTGLVRAQVACVGDGGAGSYRITLTDVPVPVLPPIAARTGTIGEGTSDHWHFEGNDGQLVFFSARSRSADVALALFDPTGVRVGSDADSGGDRDALLALRLSRTGRYTLAVTSQSGHGEYALQALEPEREK